MTKCTHDHGLTRRGLLQTGLAAGAGLVAPPLMFAPSAMGQTKQGQNGRILVVLELSGGNDGLNTVVPYADDAYYRLRPQIGMPEKMQTLEAPPLFVIGESGPELTNYRIAGRYYVVDRLFNQAER